MPSKKNPRAHTAQSKKRISESQKRRYARMREALAMLDDLQLMEKARKIAAIFAEEAREQAALAKAEAEAAEKGDGHVSGS
jgi:hypothetical protein